METPHRVQNNQTGPFRGQAKIAETTETWHIPKRDFSVDATFQKSAASTPRADGLIALDDGGLVLQYRDVAHMMRHRQPRKALWGA